MVRKVVVANRGEIACRVLATLRRLGIPSVALYHFVDRAAPHVALADETVELTGAVPTAAYLDAAQVLAVCKDKGATAIHPGYGFLSENAAFAAAAKAAGVRFIGPSAEVMRLMGDKIRSRELAIAAGVPVSPSVTNEADAAALGFPLLVKASAGGGGKGMRIVREQSELAPALALARSEAERYFGDGRVYVERFLERPRHIEVQVLGDGKGNVVQLGARECSIQRRYQKIVEETPPARIDPAILARIIDAAMTLATKAKYENAGTVEFILAADGSFYFLEMNTRLQVEHPVTEMVAGLDLVEAQLHIAEKGELPFSQSEIRANGHSIEVRICAEEPERDFRPATGRIGLLRLPSGPGIRVESGIREGQAVTAAFDSLLMKLVTHGASRAIAAARMRTALHDLVILGVATNVDYLSRVIASEPFAAGQLHTKFVEEHEMILSPAPGIDPAARIAAALGDDEFRRSAFDVPEPYASMGAFRN